MMNGNIYYLDKARISLSDVTYGPASYSFTTLNVFIPDTRHLNQESHVIS
jgi:hypothetical protein